MNFDKALKSNIITQSEYDLLAMINLHAESMDENMLASEKLNEILERVWQWERTGTIQ